MATNGRSVLCKETLNCVYLHLLTHTVVLKKMRFLNLSGINITPINGATAAIYLHESVADDQLDPYKLYHSDITPFGMRWVRELDVPLEDIEGVVTAMDSLAQKFRRRYELSNDKNK